jgi:hypothetical protein
MVAICFQRGSPCTVRSAIAGRRRRPGTASLTRKRGGRGRKPLPRPLLSGRSTLGRAPPLRRPRRLWHVGRFRLPRPRRRPPRRGRVLGLAGATLRPRRAAATDTDSVDPVHGPAWGAAELDFVRPTRAPQNVVAVTKIVALRNNGIHVSGERHPPPTPCALSAGLPPMHTLSAPAGPAHSAPNDRSQNVAALRPCASARHLHARAVRIPVRVTGAWREEAR